MSARDTGYGCKVVYRLESDSLVMGMYATGPDGERVYFSVERTVVPIGTSVAVFELPSNAMRDMLQAIVNEAAKVGIVPGDTATTIRAKDDNLKDLRGIVAALLPGRQGA